MKRRYIAMAIIAMALIAWVFLPFDLMRVGGEWRIMTHTETVILCVNYPCEWRLKVW